MSDGKVEANVVLRVRNLAGLTQRQLADLIGVNRVTIARWETNVVVVPPIVLKLFKLIEADPEDALVVLRDGQPSQRAKARPRPRKVSTQPQSKPSEPTFGGAGPPPLRQKPVAPVQTDERDSDSWKFGF